MQKKLEEQMAAEGKKYNTNPGGYIWPVVYDMHPEHPFKSIKLRSTHVLFNGLVPPEPTLAIINGWKAQNPAVIEAWEAKHGKLLSETMTQSIPDASNVPAELVTDNTDPQALAGEESYFASQADPVAAQVPSQPMESQVDQATKTQLKAILSGNDDLLEKGTLDKKLAVLESERQAFHRN